MLVVLGSTYAVQFRYMTYQNTPVAVINIHNHSKLGLQSLEIHTPNKVKKYPKLLKNDWYIHRIRSYDATPYTVFVDIFQRKEASVSLEIAPGENHVLHIYDQQIALQRN